MNGESIEADTMEKSPSSLFDGKDCLNKCGVVVYDRHIVCTSSVLEIDVPVA